MNLLKFSRIPKFGNNPFGKAKKENISSPTTGPETNATLINAEPVITIEPAAGAIDFESEVLPLTTGADTGAIEVNSKPNHEAALSITVIKTATTNGVPIHLQADQQDITSREDKYSPVSATSASAVLKERRPDPRADLVSCNHSYSSG
jgi:hypothetical protein